MERITLEELRKDLIRDEAIGKQYKLKDYPTTIIVDEEKECILVVVYFFRVYCDFRISKNPSVNEINELIDEIRDFLSSQKFKTIKDKINDILKDSKLGYDGCVYCLGFREGEHIEMRGKYADNRYTIEWKGEKTISVTVDNKDLVDDRDGIIRKVAEFFVNYEELQK